MWHTSLWDSHHHGPYITQKWEDNSSFGHNFTRQKEHQNFVCYEFKCTNLYTEFSKLIIITRVGTGLASKVPVVQVQEHESLRALEAR